MKSKSFIAATVLLGAVAVVFGGPAKKKSAVARAPVARKAVPAKPAPAKAAPGRPAPAGKTPAAAGYRPVGTVAFANLETIARTVAGIAGPGSKDVVLTQTIPSAIRNQYAAKLFGPMRPQAHGVAVCYVDPSIAARVAAARKASDAQLDRVKRWCMVYPTTMTKAAFLQRHPNAVPEANGSLRVPPGPHSQRTFWAWFAPDGQWAVLAPSMSMATHAYAYTAAARARPLGPDLVYAQMGAMGARAIFGSDLFSDGVVSVRMTAAGLELHASADKVSMKRPPLPPGALSLAGVPANSPLFGTTTTPSDVQAVEGLFTMAGPEVSKYVHATLKYLKGPGSTGFYLNVPDAPMAAAPQTRLARILPEAQKMPATATAMFSSPTTVLQHCLPKVAAKLMPMDSVKYHAALRLLRRARGDGLGVMYWNDGRADRVLIRISRDELWATASLWGMVLF